MCIRCPLLTFTIHTYSDPAVRRCDCGSEVSPGYDYAEQNERARNAAVKARRARAILRAQEAIEEARR